MNLLDAAIVVAVAASVASGFRRGAALQVLSYVGLILGLIGGALLAPAVAGLAEAPPVQAILAMLTLLVSAGLGDLTGWAVGARVWRLARRSRLRGADAVAGSLVAVAAALLATWFLAFNLVQGPFPPLSRQIRESTVVRVLDALLPQPPSVLAQVRQFLDTFGFPEVFAGLPPAPAGPVRGPSEGEVANAIDAADQSTLKVLGAACDRVQEGSGFLAADEYVVTNAHVVAGVDAPEVRQQGGGSFPATTVLFDPALDLAVLRLSSSPAEPLQVAERELGRGTPGAVLGFPAGGPLTGRAAAVRQRLTAIGRDIYGVERVRRKVYELQAVVRPGNSGGPFVTVDGTVAGVVFAASTTNGDVGYALTSNQVMPAIQRGVALTRTVDTGPCVR